MAANEMQLMVVEGEIRAETEPRVTMATVCHRAFRLLCNLIVSCFLCDAPKHLRECFRLANASSVHSAALAGTLRGCCWVSGCKCALAVVGGREAVSRQELAEQRCWELDDQLVELQQAHHEIYDSIVKAGPPRALRGRDVTKLSCGSRERDHTEVGGWRRHSGCGVIGADIEEWQQSSCSRDA